MEDTHYYCPKPTHGNYKTKDGICPVCRNCKHIFKPLTEKLDYCTKCLTQRAKKKPVILITKL